jgi:hypothetical protein
MNGYKLKKKPTIREVSNIVIELNNRINSLMGLLSELEKAFSLYVEMKKDDKKFTEFIDKKVKEMQDDTERDGESNKSNLQGDTDGESSGAEGVREEV